MISIRNQNGNFVVFDVSICLYMWKILCIDICTLYQFEFNSFTSSLVLDLGSVLSVRI